MIWRIIYLYFGLCIVFIFVYWLFPKFQDKRSEHKMYIPIGFKTIIKTFVIIFFCPPFFPYVIVKLYKKYYYLYHPEPLSVSDRNVLGYDFVGDPKYHLIRLGDYNRLRGTHYSLDQVYGRGYEATLKEKDKNGDTHVVSK